MRQARIVAVFAVAELAMAAWLAAQAPIAAALVGWVGTVTLVVSVGIATGRTGFLGKDAAGRVPWWSYALFLPWHATVRASAALARAREPVVQELRPGWYLGGWPAPAGPWTAVVDLTCELPRRTPAAAYLCAPTWDGTAPTDAALADAAAWAAAARAEGPVLVHCAHGHARSATVLAAAWVLTGEAASWQDALAIMAAARPTVRPKRDQRDALARWAARMAVTGTSPPAP